MGTSPANAEELVLASRDVGLRGPRRAPICPILRDRGAPPRTSSTAGAKTMRPIPPGTKGAATFVVAPEHLASRFKDPTLPPVLATPMMILAMENAALAAIKPSLDPGESAVGSVVNVRHLAATPLGRRVTAFAEVTKVDGRRIEFTVRALDGDELIGDGTHERVLIDVARLSSHLAAKSPAAPASREDSA
jgi:fluoroacetyl-CoA thioesterase